MKYLRLYNESLSEQSFKQALEIFAEDLPFEMNDINILFQRFDCHSNKSYYVIEYVHFDSRLDYDTLWNTQNVALRERVEADVNFYFTKFTKKYDLIYGGCLVILMDDIEIELYIDMV